MLVTRTTSPAASASASAVRPVAAGLGLGLAWGVVARVWMRLLSSDPQLTWRGTVAVVVSAGVAGALLGAANAAGRRGASGAWRALALPGVALFLGPGLPFLPAFLVGGWGMRRGRVGRAVAAGSVALAPLLLLSALVVGDSAELLAPSDLPSLLVVAGGSGLLAVTSAWAGSAAFGPWTRPATRRATAGVAVQRPAA
jgi:hypothetical protein